jgi:hypothetical protein
MRSNTNALSIPLAVGLPMGDIVTWETGSASQGPRRSGGDNNAEARPAAARKSTDQRDKTPG